MQRSQSDYVLSTNNYDCIYVAPLPKCHYLTVDESKLHNVNWLYDGNTVSEASDAFTLPGSGHIRGQIFPVPENAKGVFINMNKNLKIRDTKERKDFAQFSIGPLAEKRITCIGDSLTFIDNYTYPIDGETYYGRGWQKQLTKAGALVSSYGYSGSPYAKYGDYQTNYITGKYKTDAKDIDLQDIFLLFGGANDVRISVPIGVAPTEYNNPNIDETTFHGAIGSLIKFIRENNKHAKIYLITTTPAESGSRGWSKNKSYRDAIIYESEYWHTGLIDLFTLVNETPNYNLRDYYTYDDIHPNTYGNERIGKIILNRLVQELSL